MGRVEYKAETAKENTSANTWKLQEVEKHLSPIFVKNRTSSDCIRLKKFFQTKKVIKHWSVTSGEVVNSSAVETFKKQVGKHLSKLT